MMVKKLDSHISDEDNLTCEKVWDKFDMKNMGDYHNHYFKKRRIVISKCF